MIPIIICFSILLAIILFYFFSKKNSTKQHARALKILKKEQARLALVPRRLITSQNIRATKTGVFFGRVVWIESATINVSDYLGAVQFTTTATFNIKPGDIVKITYNNAFTQLQIKTIELLIHPKKNPIDYSYSPYSRLITYSTNYAHIQKRNLFFKGVRAFFETEGFLELHTPTLVESPGIEKHMGVFQTEYKNLQGEKSTYYLPTSPEFSLKEALTSGLTDIFEICKTYRNNGEHSNLHRPEFFMLEWYRAFSEYNVIMNDIERLVLFLCKLFTGKNSFTYNNTKINCSKVTYYTIKELFYKININLDNYSTNPESFKIQAEKVLNLENSTLTKEDLFFQCMLDLIEPKLEKDRLVFLTEYPIEMATLSEPCTNSSLYGKRFELYIHGIEIANGYGELTDPIAQRKNFETTIKERENLNLSKLELPTRFLDALAYGLPPCSGVALGLERLLMLLTDVARISETNFVEFKPEIPTY